MSASDNNNKKKIKINTDDNNFATNSNFYNKYD